MKSLCLIPFFNEENRINKNQFHKIFLSCPDIDFLLINDGSLDDTLTILIQFSKEFKNVTVQNNVKNLGKAESIRIGFQNGAESNYEIIGFYDSDFATPFRLYLHLLETLNSSNLDIIFGSRVKYFGAKIVRNPFRHYFSRILITIVSIIFNLNIYDTQCGCKIFKTKNTSNIFINKFKTNWLFDIEIFLRYFKNHSGVLEVPLDEWIEIPGSKVKFLDFLLVPIEIIKLVYEYKF
jgi:glycosyltransferase involved in cell wall biosynthesis